MPSAVPMRGLRMEDELYLKLKVYCKERKPFVQPRGRTHLKGLC